MNDALKLRSGDWVEVRSKQEILTSLDRAGQLESLPFMPEMFAFCGRRFRVSKCAHKTCDPVNGLYGRRMPRSVHLEDLRCDGSAHDGCQAGCLYYWKEAWLKRVDGTQSSGQSATDEALPHAGSSSAACTEQSMHDAIRVHGSAGELTYVCQATRVAAATIHISRWDLRQYVEDYVSGNVSLRQMVASFISEICHWLATSGFGFGSVVRALYDRVQRASGGTPYPWRDGKVPEGARTPAGTLDLKPGEMVRMKDFPRILETLDSNMRNRGLYFDTEMVPFCGGTYKVLSRVERIIHEGSGKMLTLKNPAVILDGVVCKARYAKHRKFCPRAYYQYSREIWLERATTEGERGADPLQANR
jgi:hypothetical protein